MTATEEKISGIADVYTDMIYRLSFSYMKNHQDAEDAVQDVFVKLMEKLPDFQSPEHEKAWIIRVTINVCKNKLKAFWRKNTSSLDDSPEPSKTDTYQTESEVLQAVMSLPETYRAAVHLYYYEGFKTPEIAEILQKQESSIRSILHRARKQLKTILKEDCDFEQL